MHAATAGSCGWSHWRECRPCSSPSGGAQRQVPVGLGLAGAVVFLLAIATAAVLGLKMHRQTLADREMHARRAMIVMMTASLGEQPDEKLERIEAQGGISGEAAGLILRNRGTEADG